MKINRIVFSLTVFIMLIVALAAWKWGWPYLEQQMENRASPSVMQGSDEPPHDAHQHTEENIVLMSAEQIKELGISTATAGPGTLEMTLETRGRVILHPDLLVHVLPKISGVAKEAKKNIGDFVKEGELLAVLESREIADSKAAYLAAKEKLKLALLILEREQRLYEKKVSAEQDYINAKSAFEEAKINLKLTLAKLRAFGVTEEEIDALSQKNPPDLRLYEIFSPIQGTVIARHITKGEFIENTVTIYEIADLSRLWVEIGIYPKDLIHVKKGQSVEILFPDNTHRTAEIIYLSPLIQEETITAKGIAEIKNPNQIFRPGSFVKVNIAIEQRFADILVSREALQTIDNKEVLFIKIPEGFEARQVTLGIGNQRSVQVISGLELGEEYANSKTFLLKADLSKNEAEHVH